MQPAEYPLSGSGSMSASSCRMAQQHTEERTAEDPARTSKLLSSYGNFGSTVEVVHFDVRQHWISLELIAVHAQPCATERNSRCRTLHRTDGFDKQHSMRRHNTGISCASAKAEACCADLIRARLSTP